MSRRPPSFSDDKDEHVTALPPLHWNIPRTRLQRFYRAMPGRGGCLDGRHGAGPARNPIRLREVKRGARANKPALNRRTATPVVSRASTSLLRVKTPPGQRSNPQRRGRGKAWLRIASSHSHCELLQRECASSMEGDEKSAAGAYWGLGSRPCDACGAEAARLYCRADAAFLCSGCDARAHGAGSRHARVWLCEVCEHAPAAVTCRADAAALCASCDADIHSANPLARRHERHPVAPFLGALADAPRPFASSAAVARAGAAADDDGSNNEAEAASWLLPEPDPGQKDGATEVFFADSDPYLDLDFARSMDDIKAIGVQNGPAELGLTGAKLFYSDHSMNHSVSSSEAAVVPDAAAGVPPLVAVVSRGREREARLMRYREKRKSRRFEKTIRYASRKAYAETRPRIKGRFAKRTPGAAGEDPLEEHDEEMYSSAAAAVAALMAPGGADADYGVDGVVPTF